MRYRFGDLVLDSEIPLRELPSVDDSAAECFVLQAPASTEPDEWDHRWLAPDGAVTLACGRDGDDYRLGVPGHATFEILAAGRMVRIRPASPIPPSTLEHLLIDQILPRVLALRGRLVLHAGAVLIDGGAVGFLGSSGRGKSTLCGSFSGAGHRLLSDDAIVLHDEPGGYRVVPTYRGLRLLPESMAHLYSGRADGSPVAHYTSKRRLDALRGGPAATGSVSLRALYVLDEGPAVRIEPLPLDEGYLALVAAIFQLHLGDRDRSRALFERLGALVDGVPLRRLSYPRRFDALEDVRRAVIADAASVIPASSAGCACN